MQMNPDMSFPEAKDMAVHVPWEALVGGGSGGGGAPAGMGASGAPNDVRSRRTLTLAMQRSARDREKREIRERRDAQEKAAKDAIIAKKMKLARDKAEQNRLRKMQAKHAQMKEAPKIRAKRMKRFQQQPPPARGAAAASSQHQRFENGESYDADFEMALAVSSKAYKVNGGRRQGHAGPANGSGMAVASANPSGFAANIYGRAAWGVQLAQNPNPLTVSGRTGAGAGGARGSAAGDHQPLGLARRNSDLMSQVTRMKQENEALKMQLLAAQASGFRGGNAGGGSVAAAAGRHNEAVRNDHIAQITSESWGYLLAISDDHALIQAVVRFLHEDAVHVSANGGRPADIEYAVSVCIDQRRAAAVRGPNGDSGGNVGGDIDHNSGIGGSDDDEDMEPAPLTVAEMREQRVRALGGGGRGGGGGGGGGGGAWK
jgi:hypothetical protein